jgi:hypothetical protein
MTKISSRAGVIVGQDCILLAGFQPACSCRAARPNSADETGVFSAAPGLPACGKIKTAVSAEIEIL